MEDYNLTQEMKRPEVIVFLYANHTDLEILYIHKVRHQLEASGGDAESFSKRKNPENSSKSMRALAREINVSEGLICQVVH